MEQPLSQKCVERDEPPFWDDTPVQLFHFVKHQLSSSKVMQLGFFREYMNGSVYLWVTVGRGLNVCPTRLVFTRELVTFWMLRTNPSLQIAVPVITVVWCFNVSVAEQDWSRWGAKGYFWSWGVVRSMTPQMLETCVFVESGSQSVAAH